jgi:cell fate regulator YaaT (PSP1 superfamily)
MCCLKNEQETYEELNKKLPGVGDYVTTPEGLQGTVHSVNVLRQQVKVVVEINDEKEIQEFPADELKFRPKKKKVKISEQELKELEGLEDKKGDSKLNDE